MICGVINITKSVFVFDTLEFLNSQPKTGMSPKIGILFSVSELLSRIKPLITTVSRSLTFTVVFVTRVDLPVLVPLFLMEQKHH